MDCFFYESITDTIGNRTKKSLIRFAKYLKCQHKFVQTSITAQLEALCCRSTSKYKFVAEETFKGQNCNNNNFSGKNGIRDACKAADIL